MISFVCWKWKPKYEYRSHFTAAHVNTLASMCRRNYQKPSRFICVTDDPDGIDSSIETIKLWDDFSGVHSPHGPGNPSCYRRLKAFSAEAEAMFGKRFVSIDLDTVIVGDLVPVLDRQEDFVIWGDTNPQTPYNGGLFMMTAGARRRVWETFDPGRSPVVARKKGYFGSDQAWISFCLGTGEAMWTKEDGVYSYRNEIAKNGGRLPANARLVSFHGQHDPWHLDVMAKHKWVRENYR
jgi:hypothetical protein